MPPRRYLPVSKPFDEMPAALQLPTQRPIAIYYRQSTDAQIGNISTTLQTVDMVAYLQQRGWAEELIVMIDMDAGVSGTTKIDERPGMSRLFELITCAKVGAVACQDEDRLFRDVTQIQVNIFIEACRAANVLVLTPSMVYDFANELTGLFHARQFRFKSEMAAEYINSIIRGKLHRAKRRMLMEGCWCGPGMPPGYMADMRKTLPDGSPNKQWRKFAVFEPYAEVVREYFRLFLAYAGNQHRTVRHIQEHGPYYPDPKTCLPPEGYKVVYRIRRNQGRLRPSRTGLGGILTNAQYIGHWMVNGAIVRWDNHPAIVDQDTFLRAFNYLSSVGLDGRENAHYTPLQRSERPSLDERRPVPRPLCAGMIVSQCNGVWRNLSTNWVSPLQHYTYVLYSQVEDRYVWGKKADYVDGEIERVVRQRLEATFDPELWARTVEEYTQTYGKQQRLYQGQLEQLRKVMRNLVAGLDTLTNPDMVREAQQRYEQAQGELARLQSQLHHQETGRQLEQLSALRDSCGPALDNWPNLSRAEKRSILHAFVARIEATPLPEHGLELAIHWKDGSRDTIRLNRQATTGNAWAPEETALLIALVESGEGQIEVARAFPRRKWRYISAKYYWEKGRNGKLKFRPKPIRDWETYSDYVKRVGETDPPIRLASVSCSEGVCLYEPN